MQETYSHNHLAPWCWRGFFSSLGLSGWFPTGSLLLPLSLSPNSVGLLLCVRTPLEMYPHKVPPFVLRELLENKLSPFLFHTPKIKHSIKTLPLGETDCFISDRFSTCVDVRSIEKWGVLFLALEELTEREFLIETRPEFQSCGHVLHSTNC